MSLAEYQMQASARMRRVRGLAVLRLDQTVLATLRQNDAFEMLILGQPLRRSFVLGKNLR